MSAGLRSTAGDTTCSSNATRTRRNMSVCSGDSEGSRSSSSKNEGHACGNSRTNNCTSACATLLRTMDTLGSSLPACACAHDMSVWHSSLRPSAGTKAQRVLTHAIRAFSNTNRTRPLSY